MMAGRAEEGLELAGLQEMLLEVPSIHRNEGKERKQTEKRMGMKRMGSGRRKRARLDTIVVAAG